MALKGGTLPQLATDRNIDLEELKKLNPNLDPNTTFTAGEVNFPRMINEELLRSGQDPANLEDKDEPTLQRILTTIESQINQPQQNQQSILELLSQKEKDLGIPQLRNVLFGLQEQALGLGQEQRQALQQVEERPSQSTILRGGLESELRNIQAGRTTESLPRLRALQTTLEAAGLKEQQLGRLQEEAFRKTELAGQERQFQTQQQQARTGTLLDIAKTAFGFRQAEREQRFAELQAQQRQEQQAFQNQLSLAGLDINQQRLAFDQFKARQSQIQEDQKTLIQQQESQGEALNGLSLVNTILESPKFGEITGRLTFLTGFDIGSKEVQAQVKQLQSILQLSNRQKLKGQGTISDFEGKMLANAASALNITEGGNIKMTEDAAIRQLNTIKGVFQNAAGLPSRVKITDPKDGSTEFSEATREQINQILSDGLRVEYQ